MASQEYLFSLAQMCVSPRPLRFTGPGPHEGPVETVLDAQESAILNSNDMDLALRPVSRALRMQRVEKFAAFLPLTRNLFPVSFDRAAGRYHDIHVKVADSNPAWDLILGARFISHQLVGDPRLPLWAGELPKFEAARWLVASGLGSIVHFEYGNPLEGTGWVANPKVLVEMDLSIRDVLRYARDRHTSRVAGVRSFYLLDRNSNPVQLAGEAHEWLSRQSECHEPIPVPEALRAVIEERDHGEEIQSAESRGSGRLRRDD